MKLHEIETGTAGVQQLVDAMHEAHPTTQAKVAETMCKAMYQWAIESARDNRLDPRNERAAWKIVDCMHPHNGMPNDRIFPLMMTPSGQLRRSLPTADQIKEHRLLNSGHLSMYTC